MVRDLRAWQRQRIDAGLEPADLGPRRFGSIATRRPRAVLDLGLPAALTPVPVEIDPEPDPNDPFPSADAVIVTWTKDELRALADVFTPGVNPSTRWYRYERGFDEYLPEIRGGAPARMAGRLASYHLADVGSRRVLLVKSELHLNQDSIVLPDGSASLPVRRLVHQILDEAAPRMVLTTGTSGGTMDSARLGDVVISRAARFEVAREFAGAPFAGVTYESDFRVRRTHLETAEDSMRRFADHLKEPAWGVPTFAYDQPLDELVEAEAPEPRILVDGTDFPRFHPILSADWFLFGTTTNGVGDLGAAVEMGDAVFGLVSEDRDTAGKANPRWAAVRNLSNPPINGNLPADGPIDLQVSLSALYYEAYGYWTSVNGALACWALVAP